MLISCNEQVCDYSLIKASVPFMAAPFLCVCLCVCLSLSPSVFCPSVRLSFCYFASLLPCTFCFSSSFCSHFHLVRMVRPLFIEQVEMDTMLRWELCYPWALQSTNTTMWELQHCENKYWFSQMNILSNIILSNKRIFYLSITSVKWCHKVRYKMHSYCPK